ncbi:MAG: hypothetical protein J7M27_09015 [Candidatus Latescibacteria bacterium]|nr:hypothetical protein [Candidatus Latescibacterota bacterium]
MCAEPADRGLELIVQVVVEKNALPPEIGVRFNAAAPYSNARATDELLFPNGPSRHHLSKYQAYNYRFDVGRILEGWNELVVLNEGSESDRMLSVEFAIKKA